MKERFEDWKPIGKSKELVVKINEVLTSYEAQGYKLTLRQLYYQLVSRGIIPNSVPSYKMVGNVVSNARLAGLIDWAMIEDRVRKPQVRPSWGSPADILESAAQSYHLYRWEDQPEYVEVWCEKDAVSNIIAPVCRRWDVPFMANRGYSSQTAMYDGSKRLLTAAESRQQVTIIYIGDHDPSGLDMTRDIKDRLGTFLYAARFNNVNRIALNWDQIEEYDPPPNPAKESDSRYESYAREFGEQSYELDALEPKVLSDLVEKAILEHLDRALFDAVEDREEIGRNKILDYADQARNEEE